MSAEVEWVIYCPTHRHYAAFIGVTGVTWSAAAHEATRYPTRRLGNAAATYATFADHRPLAWPMPKEATA